MFSYSSLTPNRLGVRCSVKAHCGIFKVQGRGNDRLFAFSLLRFHDGVEVSCVYSNINFISFPFFLFLWEWTHSMSLVTAFRCCGREAMKPRCRAIIFKKHCVQRLTWSTLWHTCYSHSCHSLHIAEVLIVDSPPVSDFGTADKWKKIKNACCSIQNHTVIS